MALFQTLRSRAVTLTRVLFALLAVSCLLPALYRLPAFAAQKEQSFRGEIMDSQCAMMFGHQNMKQERETARECTIRCVSNGSRYVLYAGSIYELDDQQRPNLFAGMRVTVSGTLNASTRTIHVTNILP